MRSTSSSLQCCCGFPGCHQCKQWAQQLKPLNNNSKNNNNNNKKSTKTNHCSTNKYSRGLMILGITGICMMLLSYVTYIIDPQGLAIKIVLTMSDGSFIFRIWKKPPVPVYLKVYIFNVTNADKFLAGEEKLRLQEVGPYIYREVLEHDNVRFNDNGTITFTPRRTAVPTERLLQDTAEGRGLNDRLVVPNLPLLAISSKLSEFSMLAQMGFSTLVNTVDSQPFENVSVRDYLWGYDDPIVKIAHTVFPTWITFRQLGLLDRMFDIGEDVITMDREKFSITRYNGNTLLYEGHEDLTTERDIAPPKCQETLQGVSDGVLFPANVPKTSITVYRKAFCRTLKLEYEREEPENLVNGVPGGLRFGIPGKVFNASESTAHGCHCGRKYHDSPCRLRPGLSDITNCYYGIPAAASFPHFYKADPSLLEEVDGLAPIPEEHEPYVVLQQRLGVPIGGHMRMQTNLILRKNKYVKRISRFGDMVLPIVWTDLTFSEFPSDFQWMLDLCLRVVPPVQYGFIYGAASLGFSFLLAATLGYLCHGAPPPKITPSDAPSNGPRSSSYHVVQVIMASDLLRADKNVAL